MKAGRSVRSRRTRSPHDGSRRLRQVSGVSRVMEYVHVREKHCPHADEARAGTNAEASFCLERPGSSFPGAQVIHAQAGGNDNADRNKKDIGNHGTGGVNHAALCSRQNSPACGGSADDLYGCYGRRSVFFPAQVQLGKGNLMRSIQGKPGRNGEILFKYHAQEVFVFYGIGKVFLVKLQKDGLFRSRNILHL